MNGFLVIGRCGIDDVPLGLFQTFAKADEFAATVQPIDIVNAGRRVMTVDIGTDPVCVGIVEFQYGLPREIQIVRNLID